jgi:hypothetical protein
VVKVTAVAGKVPEVMAATTTIVAVAEATVKAMAAAQMVEAGVGGMVGEGCKVSVRSVKKQGIAFLLLTNNIEEMR